MNEIFEEQSSVSVEIHENEMKIIKLFIIKTFSFEL